MEIRSLRYFLAAAETENLTRAAARTSVVQSALSHQIRKLEEEVGAELFVRNGRRLRLSEAGKVFAVEARKVIEAVELAKRRAQQVAHGELGELKVGFETITARHRLVSEALFAFRESFPQVHVDLSHMPAGPLLQALTDGVVDAAFLHLFGPSPDLDTLSFQTTDWVLALPHNHHLARGGPIRLADLRDEPFVWRARQISPAVYDRMLGVCRAGGLAPRIVQEANNDVMMINLVSVGLGLCFVVESLASNAPSDPVVFRKVDDFSMPLELCLAWRRDNPAKTLAPLCEIVRRLLAEGQAGSSASSGSASPLS
jgi:DNA-binding transcriptional LysR family regulator